MKYIVMGEVSQEFSWPCPFCAEEIPALSEICPLCDESLVRELSPELQAPLIDLAKKQLVEYFADDISSNENENEKYIGGRLGWKSYVLMIILVFFVVLVVAGLLGYKPLANMIIISSTLCLCFLVAFMVVLYRDLVTYRISESKSAVSAFKAYFTALKTGRYSRAWAAVSPEGRERQVVEPPYLEKLPTLEQSIITSFGDYKRYWGSTFKGPKNYRREIQLIEVVLENTWDNLALLRAVFRFSCIDIVGGVSAHKETVEIKKLMLSYKDKWYVAEPGFEGSLDKVIMK